MLLVALYLREKMKIYLQMPTSFIKPQIWSFRVVLISCSADDGKEMDKNEKCAECANLLSLATKYANL